MGFIKPIKKSEIWELIDVLYGAKKIKALGIDMVE